MSALSGEQVSIRIQALANLVDIDGNGSIDPVEASFFLKAWNANGF